MLKLYSVKLFCAIQNILSELSRITLQMLNFRVHATLHIMRMFTQPRIQGIPGSTTRLPVISLLWVDCINSKFEFDGSASVSISIWIVAFVSVRFALLSIRILHLNPFFFCIYSCCSSVECTHSAACDSLRACHRLVACR